MGSKIVTFKKLALDQNIHLHFYAMNFTDDNRGPSFAQMFEFEEELAVPEVKEDETASDYLQMSPGERVRRKIDEFIDKTFKNTLEADGSITAITDFSLGCHDGTDFGF